MEASRPYKLRGLELPVRILFVASTAARLRRSWDDMRNTCVVHLFIQCGEFSVRDLFDLRGSIPDQRSQLRELFFMVSAGSGRKAIEVIQKVLHLVGQRVGLPFEWRPGIAQPLLFADELFGDGIHPFLKFIGGLDDI